MSAAKSSQPSLIIAPHTVIQLLSSRSWLLHTTIDHLSLSRLVHKMATATANFTTGIMLILAACLLLAFPLTAAQTMAPAPVPSDDCFSYLTNVSDCLTYVEAQSNLTKPDKGCCPEFAGLVDSHPICLCELLNNANSFGIQINVSKALMLPSVCGVTTPPLSACSGSRSSF